MDMKNLLARSIGRLTAVAATTALMAGSAAAADIKAAPVYKALPPVVADPWTGFYGGLNAGGAIGRNHTTDTESTAGTPALLPIIGGDNVNHAPVGGVFGAQLGWNWHAAPSWVLGLEADAQWSRQSESVCISACLPTLPPVALLGVIDQQSLTWFGTARGRVGWLAPNGSLWYATGGAAWGRVKDTVTLTATPGFLADGAPNAANFSHNRLGWTLGGGVEAPFAPHWTAKAEYLYVDLGHAADSFTSALSPVVFPGGTMTTTHDTSFHDHIVRLGVNYHFGEESGAMASAAPAASYYKAPPAAPMGWNGFYAGLNGGGSLARNHTVDTSLVPGITPPDFGDDDFRHSPFGAIAGGQVGVNWQPARSWMLGLEADMQWSGEKDTACISQCLPVGAPGAATLLGVSDEQSMKWFGTARGRFGWVAPNGTLWYATGGLAWGHVEQTLTLNATPAFLLGTTSAAASFSHNKVGWTVGAGVEAPLWNGWSAKAEYLYVDLGSVSDTFSVPLDPGQGVPAIITNSSYTIHDNIVRIGVNYHLH
jgi:outer membrane immunogenic protein